MHWRRHERLRVVTHQIKVKSKGQRAPLATDSYIQQLKSKKVEDLTQDFIMKVEYL